MCDEISQPIHYQGETVDAMTAMASCLNVQPGETPEGKEITPTAHYWHGCAMKYLFRWSRKSGLKDLLKARQCIDYLIGEVYGPDALPN